MIARVSTERRNATPPDRDGRRELRHFATKLGLPAGLAGIFAVGGIAGGTTERPSARYWIDALGFGLAAFVAHVAGAALR